MATRSSGMQSDKYGDIADITRGFRVAMPGDVLVIRALPSTSTGPSVREMILGSEGRLGVITEVTVQVHRIPEERLILGYLFPSWDAGLAAMQEISTSDAHPSITRVSDARETASPSPPARRARASRCPPWISKGLMKVLQGAAGTWRGVPVVHRVRGRQGPRVAGRRPSSKIVGKHGGIVLGKGPGVLYDQKKFDTPYMRDFLLDRGAAGDVSETAAPWSKLPELYGGHIDAANPRTTGSASRAGSCVTCRTPTTPGACLYFTFAFRSHSDDPLGQYDVVKSAIQQSFVDNGGTLSHHHAVGTEHAPLADAGHLRRRRGDDGRPLHRRRPRPQPQPREDHHSLSFGTPA